MREAGPKSIKSFGKALIAFKRKNENYVKPNIYSKAGDDHINNLMESLT